MRMNRVDNIPDATMREGKVYLDCARGRRLPIRDHVRHDVVYDKLLILWYMYYMMECMSAIITVES
jgi:hypothetical protein